jgi:hypothetical protein
MSKVRFKYLSVSLSVGLAALLCFASFLSGTSPALAATAPSLGTAGNYAVLAGTTVTNTGPTAIIGGDVGVAPGSAITGFPPGTVTGGIIHVGNDAATILAKTDLVNAYNAAAGQPFDTDLTGQDLGGMTLVPGVYSFSSFAQLTGTLTLSGGPTDVWIFQIGSTLTTASNSSVVFRGQGGQNCNVFWQVGSSATLGTATAFVGNILALTTITLDTNATLAGRALARNGAVNLAANAITVCSICNPIIVTSAPPIPLPPGAVGAAYGPVTFTASGGTAPYTYTVTSGAVPPPMVLNPATGVLSGIPNAAGSYTFIVTATDSTPGIPGCSGSQIYTIDINAAQCGPITLSPTSLPSATPGIFYSQTITASGGNAPYTYTKTFGSYPPGVTLSAGGVLSGTPTMPGSYTFTVTATDSTVAAPPCSGSQIYTLLVNCPVITISPTTLPDGTQFYFYNQTITASGGTAPYTFSVGFPGPIPPVPGLTLASNGTLSGTPTTPGSYTFTVIATDANSCAGSQIYTIQILAAPPTRKPSAPRSPAPGGVNISPQPMTPNFVVTRACVERQGQSDKITLCVKNTTSSPLKFVAKLLANNTQVGQKSFDVPPNGDLCDSWLVDATQGTKNYSIDIDGHVQNNLPICPPGGFAPTPSSNTNVWIYFVIALVVILIIIALYFIMRRRK